MRRLQGDLGTALTPAGTVEADPFGRTTVPGVFAAGDITAPIQQVAGAVGAGAAAAVAIVHDLVIVGRPLERRA